uniref:Apoptosis regulatory protein Siva-like n=1 Tax=Phallusia mammillata TaxID=59560 RepID=A0A6F9DRL3_9ASCI|nr:apoptosis regulatory protein Siva-like [Phallusia mammillata]
MTKRQNPWSEDTPMQMKTHISTKEVANGIDGASYKYAILDHTRQLLLNGAKQFYSKIEQDEQNVLNNNDDNIESCEKHQQKSIIEFFSKGNKPHNQKQIHPKTVQLPNACSHLSPTSNCEFCLNSICQSCGRTCASCDKQYCSNCSILSYEGSTESALCFSCKT